MKRVRSNRSLTSSLVRVLTMFIVSTSAAGISSTIIFTSPLSALGATKDPGSRTLLPDLFTGTLSHAIPIDVPPGRKGLDPSLVLSYRSGSGNSWVGVGWDLNTGLYGQEKSITDPNGATISTHYDVFGRKIRVTAPDSSWSTFAYNSLGAGIGVQHARTTNSGGLSTWSYFDGFNRPVIEKRTGPEGKLIVTRTKYDSRGAVVETSLPHFDGATPLWQRMTYDAAGPLLSMQNPDGSRTLNCYKEWGSVSIDANGHRRRETRNAFGRVVKVEEYTGIFATCTTQVGTPYATTVYRYDVVGNLLSVTDAKGNVTTMQYDTLSRKRSMRDPDMGT